MGSRKGLEKKLAAVTLIIPVNKGDKPLTSGQIREYFLKARAARKESK